MTWFLCHHIGFRPDKPEINPPASMQLQWPGSSGAKILIPRSLGTGVITGPSMRRCRFKALWVALILKSDNRVLRAVPGVVIYAWSERSGMRLSRCFPAVEAVAAAKLRWLLFNPCDELGGKVNMVCTIRIYWYLPCLDLGWYKMTPNAW